MTMDYETLSLMEQLAPDLMKKLTLRAMVLERISVLQPVGRRALAQRLHMPEREIRSICDALKEDGLIWVGSSGMNTTERADGLIPLSRTITGRRSALGHLEQHLSRILNVSRVCIVPGNADSDTASEDGSASGEIACVAARHLSRLLLSGTVLAVSGGRLTAAAAAAMHTPSPPDSKSNIRVLPVRGVIDTEVEIQANTVAAKFAHALHGSCLPLHLPDTAPAEALRELLRLPPIAEALRTLEKTDVLLYEVQCAQDAARAANLAPEHMQRLIRSNAVGEAAGCYFDAAGKMVLQPSAVGLRAEQLPKINFIVALAAGSSRAKALLSVLRHHRHELLVLDEGAARALEMLI